LRKADRSTPLGLFVGASTALAAAAGAPGFGAGTCLEEAGFIVVDAGKITSGLEMYLRGGKTLTEVEECDEDSM